MGKYYASRDIDQAACAVARIRVGSSQAGLVMDRAAAAGFLRVIWFPLPIIHSTNSFTIITFLSSNAGIVGHLVASVIVDSAPLRSNK
jgi:hypothetical protein